MSEEHEKSLRAKVFEKELKVLLNRYDAELEVDNDSEITIEFVGNGDPYIPYEYYSLGRFLDGKD